MNQSDFDVGEKLTELSSWVKEAKSSLETMDKEQEKRLKELNDQLTYYLSIESLNKHQEDLTPYLVELLSLVQYRLIDSISMDTIHRVQNFNSEKHERLTNTKPKQFVKRENILK